MEKQGSWFRNVAGGSAECCHRANAVREAADVGETVGAAGHGAGVVGFVVAITAAVGHVVLIRNNNFQQ